MLDMVVSLHKRILAIIDVSLLEGLHTRSVKMLDLAVKTRDWLAEHITTGPEGASQIPNGSTGELDRKKVLNGGACVDILVGGEGKYTECSSKRTHCMDTASKSRDIIKVWREEEEACD